jgi:hypothetical protein
MNDTSSSHSGKEVARALKKITTLNSNAMEKITSSFSGAMKENKTALENIAT